MAFYMRTSTIFFNNGGNMGKTEIYEHRNIATMRAWVAGDEAQRTGGIVRRIDSEVTQISREVATDKIAMGNRFESLCPHSLTTAEIERLAVPGLNLRFIFTPGLAGQEFTIIEKRMEVM